MLSSMYDYTLVLCTYTQQKWITSSQQNSYILSLKLTSFWILIADIEKKIEGYEDWWIKSLNYLQWVQEIFQMIMKRTWSLFDMIMN